MGRPECLGEPVSEIMEKPFPVIESTVAVSAAVSHLKDHAAVLVRRDGKIAGILSRYDLLRHLAGR
jgi:cystathionine beta-synthase